MSKESIEAFCIEHHACALGRSWAMMCCGSMRDAWNTCIPEYRVWIATRPRVLSREDTLKFASWMIHGIFHLIKDERSMAAVVTADRMTGALDSNSYAAMQAVINAEYAYAEYAFIELGYNYANPIECQSRGAAWYYAMCVMLLRDYEKWCREIHILRCLYLCVGKLHSVVRGGSSATVDTAFFEESAAWLKDNTNPNLD